MIPINKKTDELITKIADNIEYKFEHEGCPVPIKKINSFMLDCLSQIKNDYPEVVREGIEISDAFCRNAASAPDLENVRIRCWQYLKEKNKILDTKNADACKVRAAICAMHSEMKAHLFQQLVL